MLAPSRRRASPSWIHTVGCYSASPTYTRRSFPRVPFQGDVGAGRSRGRFGRYGLGIGHTHPALLKVERGECPCSTHGSWPLRPCSMANRHRAAQRVQARARDLARMRSVGDLRRHYARLCTTTLYRELHDVPHRDEVLSPHQMRTSAGIVCQGGETLQDVRDGCGRSGGACIWAADTGDSASGGTAPTAFSSPRPESGSQVGWRSRRRYSVPRAST